MSVQAEFGDPRLPARFWNKVRVDPSGCWIWLGAKYHNGYGVFCISRGKSVRAHRMAFTELVGPIPDGLQCDHLCRNRACLNPAHIEPVTHQENVLRGMSVTAENARKTTCAGGHSLVNAKLMTGKRKGRRCLECALIYRRKVKASGVCPRCCKPRTSDKYYCAECMTKRRARSEASR